MNNQCVQWCKEKTKKCHQNTSKCCPRLIIPLPLFPCNCAVCKCLSKLSDQTSDPVGNHRLSHVGGKHADVSSRSMWESNASGGCSDVPAAVAFPMDEDPGLATNSDTAVEADSKSCQCVETERPSTLVTPVGTCPTVFDRPEVLDDALNCGAYPFNYLGRVELKSRNSAINFERGAADSNDGWQSLCPACSKSPFGYQNPHGIPEEALRSLRSNMQNQTQSHFNEADEFEEIADASSEGELYEENSNDAVDAADAAPKTPQSTKFSPSGYQLADNMREMYPSEACKKCCATQTDFQAEKSVRDESKGDSYPEDKAASGLASEFTSEEDKSMNQEDKTFEEQRTSVSFHENAEVPAADSSDDNRRGFDEPKDDKAPSPAASEFTSPEDKSVSEEPKSFQERATSISFQENAEVPTDDSTDDNHGRYDDPEDKAPSGLTSAKDKTISQEPKSFKERATNLSLSTKPKVPPVDSFYSNHRRYDEPKSFSSPDDKAPSRSASGFTSPKVKSISKERESLKEQATSISFHEIPQVIPIDSSYDKHRSFAQTKGPSYNHPYCVKPKGKRSKVDCGSATCSNPETGRAVCKICPDLSQDSRQEIIYPNGKVITTDVPQFASSPKLTPKDNTSSRLAAKSSHPEMKGAKIPEVSSSNSTQKRKCCAKKKKKQKKDNGTSTNKLQSAQSYEDNLKKNEANEDYKGAPASKRKPKSSSSCGSCSRIFKRNSDHKGRPKKLVSSSSSSSKKEPESAVKRDKKQKVGGKPSSETAKTVSTNTSEQNLDDRSNRKPQMKKQKSQSNCCMGRKCKRKPKKCPSSCPRNADKSV